MKMDFSKKWIVGIILAGIIVLIATVVTNRLLFVHQPEITFPNDWFYMQRAYPSGRINHEAYVAALRKADLHRNQLQKGLYGGNWEFRGPLNTGGRISAVAMHPSDPETVFAGAASGGVFKSTNGGNTWQAVFDNTLSLSIGDIAIAPTDKSVIYVGTGESNCGGGSMTYDGIGLYKSENGGSNWEYIGLENSRNVGRITIHPHDPDYVFVAAMGDLFGDSPDRGVYRTIDGGLTWEQVLYLSDSTGAIDLAMNPLHPDTLYAAMWERIRRPDRRSYGGITCGIYRSFDGGDTWTELTNGLPSPSINMGRIGISISESDPEILYAIYADKIGSFYGIYRTVDNGDSWIQVNDGSLSGMYFSYGWWFGRIRVDPVDPDIVYGIGFDLYKTSDGGNSWSNISEWTVHVDQHDLYVHPMSHQYAVLGNDGGIYVTQNGGNSWTFLNNLPITQFYTCEVDYQYPQRLYGGTQDNGTNRTMTGQTGDWENIYGGDGFYVLVDPVNNNYVYAEYQYGALARSTNGGNSFASATSGISSSDRNNWNTPVIFNPLNPKSLYYGANRLYKTKNRAVSWSVISPDLSDGPGQGNVTYGTITAIAVSPVDTNIIYAGTDDGNVWTSRNNGENWTDITLGLPDRWVTSLAADPLDTQVAYVTFSGYRYNEYIPHVLRTADGGDSWMDITGNLPEAPVNKILVDPVLPQILYIGTDMGVFMSTDLGVSWFLAGIGLPNLPIPDLKFHQPTRTLIAATYGRSMYSIHIPESIVSVNYPEKGSCKGEISLSPNPVSGMLNVDFPDGFTELAASALKYEIFTSSGFLVQKGYFELKRNLQIPVNDLEEGLYILSVDGGKFSAQFIKISND
jgi:photosystem II stability/assembly factor-like uncharacterized protein